MAILLGQHKITSRVPRPGVKVKKKNTIPTKNIYQENVAPIINFR